MRKAEPREGKGLAGPQSQLLTPSPAAFHSTSLSDMLPEQEEEAGGRVTTEKDTPRRLASSSQGADRGEVGLLGEEVPRTPAHTHVHTHTPQHTHRCLDTLSLESRLVP